MKQIKRLLRAPDGAVACAIRRLKTTGLLMAGLAALVLAQTATAAEERSFAILAVNDVYRIDGLYNGTVGGPARLRSLRLALEADYPDLLLLHAGDIIAPSFLSRSYHGEQMIDVLNLLDGDLEAFDQRMFVTFGNHEFDRGKLKDAEILNALVADSRFTWLGSNIRFASGPDGRPLIGGPNLADSLLVESGGVRVGLFGLTIDSERPAYVVEIAEPIARAERLTALLRAQGAEFVVALTHLPLASDQAILTTLGEAGPDLIVGGHEHSRQTWPAEAPRIFKADADVRSASVIEVTLPAAGAPVIRQRFEEPRGEAPPPDPQVAARAQGWLTRHSEAFCAADGSSADCLEAVLGQAGVELVAEEEAIRSRETNFGNWLADQALRAFRDAGAQVAAINSGSLRLNQNIGAGTQHHPSGSGRAFPVSHRPAGDRDRRKHPEGRTCQVGQGLAGPWTLGCRSQALLFAMTPRRAWCRM